MLFCEVFAWICLVRKSSQYLLVILLERQQSPQFSTKLPQKLRINMYYSQFRTEDFGKLGVRLSQILRQRYQTKKIIAAETLSKIFWSKIFCAKLTVAPPKVGTLRREGPGDYVCRSEMYLRSVSEISSRLLGPRPCHIEIQHRVKNTSTTDLFGFETLKFTIRKLKLWKPTVCGKVPPASSWADTLATGTVG